MKGIESIVESFSSHPSWVCGLKLKVMKPEDGVRVSHPSWVCGLKLDKYGYQLKGITVTPFVGVWIETKYLSLKLDIV